MSDSVVLREHLFGVLKGLRAKTIDIDHAKVINETAQVLINLAKAEIDYMKVTDSRVADGFIKALPESSAAPGANPAKPATTQVTRVPGGSITRHRLL